MNNITLLAQQMDTYLKGTVVVDNDFKAEKKFYEQYGTNAFVQISSRYADTPLLLPSHYRRMVTPQFYVAAQLEDPIDALQMLVDPKGTYYSANLAGANRQIDDIIIGSYVATAYVGKDGTSTQSFTAANLSALSTSALSRSRRALISFAFVIPADPEAIWFAAVKDCVDVPSFPTYAVATYDPMIMSSI